MANIKTFRDVVNSMLRYLHLNRPNVDVSPGTFTRDVVVDAVASELETLYLDLYRVSNAQSPDLAAIADVEKLGSNFQVMRKGPTKATGVVTFYSFNSPASPVTISQGTQLFSKVSTGYSAQQFITTQDVILSVLNFNADTGRYEINCNIRAVVAGTSANVPPGAISAMMNPIAGVDGVYNYNAITNGSDFEPISQFRARLKSTLLGNNIGTINGYYNTLIQNQDVVDASISALGTGTITLTRNTPGAVDAYIRGLVSTQDVETYVVPITTPRELIVSKQPIDILAKDTFNLTGSVTGELVYGTHYTIITDTSNLAGSINASDKFVFTSSVVVGETITITYSYNSLIETLQNYMENDSRKVLGADLLVRSAKPRKINIECTIRVLSGYTASTVATAVSNALATALNTYTIGEEVQQSDLLAVIVNTTGVDDVNIPLTTFQEDSSTGSLVQNSLKNIVIPADSYATTGTITVNIRA